jgi:hypothetical protein
MTTAHLIPGDEVDAVVTTVTPFGVFVRTDAGVCPAWSAARAATSVRFCTCACVSSTALRIGSAPSRPDETAGHAD